ncbi:dipeptidase [Amphibacillus sp. Q70]|uniref:dipeptidase n=1 Tax=Amphibacillus sp. Q70 TaxID=3453416 RepID=UPI003F84FFAF
MIIDAHCDLLYQLWKYDYDVNSSEFLQFDLTKWRNSPVRVQAFAIFVPSSVPSDQQYDVALKMIDLFFEKIIIPNPDIIHIKTKTDLENLQPNQLGAMLTLEGCHPIGMNLNKLTKMIDYGVRMVGLTWNNNNAVADSIMSAKREGITAFGQEVIQLLNQESIWIDVSHLSIKGFYDVINQADHVIASHSNAFTICQHPRNLDDYQIKALIERDGLIGLTFVPEFTKASASVEIADLFTHIDHFITIGALNHLGFGSDFDGITETIMGLSSVTDYASLQDQLIKRYSQSTINKISYQNFLKKFPRTK